MICYRDRTYCPYFMICRDGYKCDRALTDKIQKDAEKWWGKPGAPICVYSEFPSCFVRWFEPEKDGEKND